MTSSPMNGFSPWNVTVREICQTLGWGGDLGTTRHFKILSLQVSEFRKRTIGNDGFSIDLNDAKLRRCASQFCDRELKRREFFVPSKGSDYPSLPDNREEIEEGIAKILCLQEYYRRRNEDSKSKRASQNVKGKGPVGDDGDNEGDNKFGNGTSSDEMGKPDDDDDDDDEEFTPRERQDVESESSITVRTPARKVGNHDTTKRTKTERMIQNEEAIQYNIDQHLNYVYSLDSSQSPVYQAYAEEKEHAVTDSGVCWLFEGSTAIVWPEAAKILAWRFMHDHDLYSLNPGIEELTTMGRLVTLLTEYVHIKVDSTHHAVVFEKTRKFVVYTTRKFIREYGLLQQFEDGTIRRSPNFESGLQIQKETWKKIHKVSPVLNSQSPDSPPPKSEATGTYSAAAGSKYKRVNSADIANETTRPSGIDEYTEFIHKRQRTIIGTEPQALAPAAESAKSADRQSSLNTQAPTKSEPSSEIESSHVLQTLLASPSLRGHAEALPPRDTPGRLLTRFRPHERHVSSDAVDNRPHRRDHNSSATRLSSPRGRSPYRVYRSQHLHPSPHHLSRQSSTSSFGHQHQLSRQSSNSSIGINEPLNEMNISSLYPQVLSGSVTANSEAFDVPDPSEPQDITFILHNKSSTLDFESPVPFHVFRNTTVSSFFTLYSQRSGIELENLDTLTFTVVFANHLTFAMSRDEDDQSWRRLKKRIGSLYLLTRERRPNETDFEVWVDAGEMGTVG